MSDLGTKDNPYTADQWRQLAIVLFGDDEMQWRFKCPSCKHEASIQDYKDAGAPQGAVGFSCIGRWLPGSREAFGDEPGPCNYAGGGLIGLNPVFVDDGEKVLQVFEFGSLTAVETVP